jgi:hypothetical protein
MNRLQNVSEDEFIGLEMVVKINCTAFFTIGLLIASLQSLASPMPECAVMHIRIWCPEQIDAPRSAFTIVILRCTLFANWSSGHF